MLELIIGGLLLVALEEEEQDRKNMDHEIRYRDYGIDIEVDHDEFNDRGA